jgi:DNA end-binding protein Ku
MHTIWKGSIGFALVNIPVRMYAAVDESTLPFISLDKNNNARIKYQKVNEVTGKVVKHEDIVKGYKMGDGFVIVEEEDFKNATPEKIDHLEIVQFVNEKEVDAVYFEKPYYLAPEKGAIKPYSLLRDALKREGTAALGPLVYHKKEWIGLIKPLGDILVLHRLRFAQEIRPSDQIAVPHTEVKEAELKIASQLIKQLTQPFNPEQFKDEFTDKLLKAIEARANAKGKNTPVKPMKVVHSVTEDLMEKLKASLKAPNKKAS